MEHRHTISLMLSIMQNLDKKLGSYQEIAESSEILPSCAAIKNKAFADKHHITDTQKIEPPRYKYCIIARQDSKPQKSHPAAHCVASADGMAHISQVPSLLYAAYKKHNMDIDTGRLWVKNKLERTWKKLNPIAQEIMYEKYIAACKTLE